MRADPVNLWRKIGQKLAIFDVLSHCSTVKMKASPRIGSLVTILKFWALESHLYLYVLEDLEFYKTNF